MDRAIAGATVGDIARGLAESFPVERAEEWDRNGLLAGDPDARALGVSLALDPTVDSVRAAHAAGANVLVTHHPAYLSPPATITPAGHGAAAVVYEALVKGVALINAHTNLDRDPRAQRLIPETLGLVPTRPLESAPQPRALVTVYVPDEALEAVTLAMIAAGAGRIGDYTGCSFTGEGTGSFTAPVDGAPYSGGPGAASQVRERRLEMVCPRALAGAVCAAAVSKHPYEEPLVTVSDVLVAPNAAAFGMLCRPAGDEPLTLAALAARARVAFGVTARVWGDPRSPVSRVATATGSGGSLVGAARSAGADVLVAGEVRYHDALDARDSGLSVIEVGHDVSEWPLVGLLESVVRRVPGLDGSAVTVQPARAGWWTVDDERVREG